MHRFNLFSLAVLFVFVGASHAIFVWDNNNDNRIVTTTSLNTGTLTCFGVPVAFANNNNAVASSQNDICLIALVGGLILLIAGAPFVLGLDGGLFRRSGQRFGPNQRRDPGVPPQFKNPYENQADPQSQFAQKKSPSLKEKLSQAVDDLKSSFSNNFQTEDQA